MNANKIFIALFSIFLLIAPQAIIYASVEVAEDLEGSISKELESLGEGEGKFAEMSEEQAENLASKMSKLEKENPDAYEKITKKYGDQLKKSEQFTQKFAQKQKEALEEAKEQESILENQVKN